MNEEKLSAPLPEWAIKPNPMNSNMSVIHPMAIIDRLNEVFGVGMWSFKTEYIHHEAFMQQTKKGERPMFRSAVKGTLLVKDVVIEQYGGSSNDDLGDALKGGATDSLTKCASYLGVGASIYKGQGNTAPMTCSVAQGKLKECDTVEALKNVWTSLPQDMRDDPEVLATKEDKKNALTNS